jgi:hypothetical protein
VPGSLCKEQSSLVEKEDSLWLLSSLDEEQHRDLWPGQDGFLKAVDSLELAEDVEDSSL